MKILQKLPYKLKTALPILALAGASMVPVSCSDDDEKDLKHDVELEWFRGYYDEIGTHNIQRQLDDPLVNMVYLKYVNKGYTFPVDAIHPVLIPYLDGLMSANPARIRGRGNFQWPVGECPKEDSLWLVSKGWTVNTPPAQNQR